MNLSSVLVYSSLKNIDRVIEALTELPGVEVHHYCRYSGRIVVIQEQEDTEQQVQSLQRIKALRHVVAAEMVYHYMEVGNGLTAMDADMQEPATWV